MSDFFLKREGVYQLTPSEEMRVPGLFIASPELLAAHDLEQALQQVRNVAALPGIVGQSIAMPDMHWGYGFPIGGVAATDAKTGVISPGGVGYDINCGVRLALAPIQFSTMNKTLREKLLTRLFECIPSGVGRGHQTVRSLSASDYKKLLESGASWSVEMGYGFNEDLERCESHGVIAGASSRVVSSLACDRGSKQLGTIGSGNHFVEVGEIETLFDPKVAEAWGVNEGQLYVLIHSGSRGFGHQVCTDFLERFLREGYAKDLPDKQLVAAPLASSSGQDYFHAMAAAANYAFNNRQQILHEARQVFKEVCGIEPKELRLLYDVCHNIAKLETHTIEGKERQVCVHRKGATRAFGPGHPELAPLYKKTGQPVLVPGDMGRASHLMVGEGNPLTFCSSCHGAGRARSRHQSQKAWKGRDPKRYMRDHGVGVRAHSMRTITEEMPDAYKDVDLVVDAVELAGLAKRVARLKPKLVIKG